MDEALHESTAIIILYVSFPFFLWHSVLFCESLFFEVSNSEIISVSQQILYASALHVFFEFIHESCAISTDLLVRCHS